MADDQATLGTFAEGDTDRSDDDAPASGGSEGDPDEERTAHREAPLTAAPADDLVCPWCLAPAESFVERGLTGLACGRCSAALPTDAEWFRERDVVARRPMYEVEA